MAQGITGICKQIEKSNDRELSRIVQAVLSRYRVLYPDEEVIFLSLPIHDREERAKLWALMTEQAMRP